MKTYFFRNPFASSRSTQRWKAVGPLLPRSRNIFPSRTRLDSGREHERLAISGFRWSRTRYRFDFIVLSSKITSHIFCLDIWMKLCITKLEQFLSWRVYVSIESFPEITSSMAIICREVRKIFPANKPVGEKLI